MTNPVNVNAIIEAVKKAGAVRTRVVPMPGESVDGKHQIEIHENGSWSPVGVSMSSKVAHDLVSQATNRVILG